ncbi:YoaK family protein [uncultured Ruminococcus sp.]|jgi:uncharacterized membrane protein YoaK (UPF0700 family)|uniref:YoaK family protein n=1 Tax=uncultured Ruminococcus sp. TaxID=165186 RepID=UPI002665E506|nr:YoaK family protein [uncultured Ruminococcus sp.]
MKKLRGQISESRRLAILLAVSGGFMDAYTYTFRGEVFANAQTGNIILLAINLSEGNFEKMLQYLFPVIAFAFGIIIAEVVHRFCTIDNILHWRQYTVLLECIILFSVGFISQEYNMIANSLVSFACGIQVESFRKVKGNASATTMCIGNLRSGTQNLFNFIFNKDKECLRKSLIYYGVIFFFAFGAVIENFIIGFWKQYTIWCSCILLFAGFLLMFLQAEEEDKQTYKLK